MAQKGEAITCMHPIGDEIEAVRALVDPLSPERKRIKFCARALNGARIALEAARNAYDLRDRGWPRLAGQVASEKVPRWATGKQYIRRPEKPCAYGRGGKLVWKRRATASCSAFAGPDIVTIREAVSILIWRSSEFWRYRVWKDEKPARMERFRKDEESIKQKMLFR